MVAELPHQALGRAPERDHEVGHGQVHQVVIHRGPACQVGHKDNELRVYVLPIKMHFVKESFWDEGGFKNSFLWHDGSMAG